MTTEQLRTIADAGNYWGPKGPTQLIETHISWVLLTPAYAFKVKKPVRLSFLDFSTLEQRAFYCREEVRLNRRLAPEVYLGLLAVQSTPEGHLSIGPRDEGQMLFDYAVWMRRLDGRYQMDRLLRERAVRERDMEILAHRLVDFHRAHALPADDPTRERASDYLADFADLLALNTAVERQLGQAAARALKRWHQQIAAFLCAHEDRLEARAQAGFRVEGHGDLHARNIFLLPEGPVVFDCLEFSARFRCLDVLNELAFLAMDLEAQEHPSLSHVFMNAYLHRWPCLEGPEDERLFQYFKAYRASVRLKIALIEGEQNPQSNATNKAQQYWNLLEKYIQNL